MALILRSPLSAPFDWLVRLDAWMWRLAERISTVEECFTSITMEIEGLEDLRLMFGLGAVDHVSRIMLRLLQNETKVHDLVYRKDDGTFEAILKGDDEELAHSIVSRVEAAFRQAVFDAGYSQESASFLIRP